MAQQFDFTVRATDEDGSFADRNFSITVNNTVVPRFVAVNSTEVYHSNDGMEWFKNTGFTGIYDVEYGAGEWFIPRTVQSLYRSSDGVNWSLTPYTLDPGAPQPTFLLYKVKYIAADNKWYGFTRQGNIAQFFESTDNGLTWDYIASIAGMNTVFQALDFDKSGNNLVARIDDEIRYSTNGGTTWSIGQAGFPTTQPQAEVIFINNAWFVMNYSNIWRSFNLSTWTNILTTTTGDSLVYANGNILVRKATVSRDIFISQDAGDNFTQYNPSNKPDIATLTSVRRGMAFYNGIYVWAGNGQIKWAIEPDVAWFDATAGNAGGNTIATPIAIASRI